MTKTIFIVMRSILPSNRFLEKRRDSHPFSIFLKAQWLKKKKKGKLTMSCSGLKTLLVNTYVTHILLHT